MSKYFAAGLPACFFVACTFFLLAGGVAAQQQPSPEPAAAAQPNGPSVNTSGGAVTLPKLDVQTSGRRESDNPREDKVGIRPDRRIWCYRPCPRRSGGRQHWYACTS